MEIAIRYSIMFIIRHHFSLFFSGVRFRVQCFLFIRMRVHSGCNHGNPRPQPGKIDLLSGLGTSCVSKYMVKKTGLGTSLYSLYGYEYI